jgi:hypothetical protein
MKSFGGHHPHCRHIIFSLGFQNLTPWKGPSFFQPTVRMIIPEGLAGHAAHEELSSKPKFYILIRNP